MALNSHKKHLKVDNKIIEMCKTRFYKTII